MKTTTKKTLFALSLACALLLSPVLIKAEKGSGSGGIYCVSMMRSMIIFSPVTITNTDNSVIVDINTDMGDVIVDVIDENGFVVYTLSVDTSSQSQFTIDTANFASGTYSIVFINADGETIVEDTFLY